MFILSLRFTYGRRNSQPAGLVLLIPIGLRLRLDVWRGARAKTIRGQPDGRRGCRWQIRFSASRRLRYRIVRQGWGDGGQRRTDGAGAIDVNGLVVMIMVVNAGDSRCAAARAHHHEFAGEDVAGHIARRNKRPNAHRREKNYGQDPLSASARHVLILCVANEIRKNPGITRQPRPL